MPSCYNKARKGVVSLEYLKAKIGSLLKGGSDMYELNCVSGCLPQELDEIMDSLEDMRSDLQNNFESADPEPTSKEELEIFKRHIDALKENLEHYKKHCLKCKKNGGKLKLYQESLKQVQDLWDLLSI